MTGHDKLFKDLFRSFFPDLLHLAHPGLAARWFADPGSRDIKFLDKELYLPGGRRREADLLAEIPVRSDRPRRTISLDQLRRNIPTIERERGGRVRQPLRRPKNPGGRDDAIDMG